MKTNTILTLIAILLVAGCCDDPSSPADETKTMFWAEIYPDETEPTVYAVLVTEGLNYWWLDPDSPNPLPCPAGLVQYTAMKPATIWPSWTLALDHVFVRDENGVGGCGR